MKKIRDSRIVTDVKVYMIGMRAVTIFFNFFIFVLSTKYVIFVLIF
jgi:hypothetical protein